MALIICDECNKEFSDTLSACPHCGKKISNEKPEINNILLSIPKITSKKIILIIVGILIIVAVLAINGMPSKDEKIAINNCKELISMLKNPDSFKLYNDVEILREYDVETDELTGEYTYINYGAENGYGGMSRGLAAFDDEGYIGDLNDDLEKSDFPSSERYKAYAMADIARIGYATTGEEKQEDLPMYYKLETISANKVNSNLNLD